MLKVFSCCYSESLIKKKKLFSARNIVNSLLVVYPVEIAPYGTRFPHWLSTFLLIFYKGEEFTHADDCNIPTYNCVGHVK